MEAAAAAAASQRLIWLICHRVAPGLVRHLVVTKKHRIDVCCRGRLALGGGLGCRLRCLAATVMLFAVALALQALAAALLSLLRGSRLLLLLRGQRMHRLRDTGTG